MIPKQEKKVILFCESLNERAELNLSHAQALMDLQRKKGYSHWKFPENSQYELDKNGNIIERKSSGSDKKSSESNPTPKREETGGEDQPTL